MDKDVIAKFLVFLSERSSEVFWIRNADYTKLIYISPAYEMIWQRSAKELYNYPERWYDYLHPEDRQCLDQSLKLRKPNLSMDTEFYTEYRILRPTGEIRYIQDHSFPIFDEAREHIGFAGIARDVTDEKLLSQSLLASKNAAEAANRAKTEFLANMSHDVKTPLTGVVTMADVMVHDTMVRETDRERAKVIYASGKQIVSLFDSCLDLSKLEMQEWFSRPEIFSLRELLDDMLALFLPKAISQNLSLTIDYDKALPYAVEGPRESLYRVLLNLLGNALKFTEKGGVLLKAVSGPSSDGENVMVEFHVQDTGVGIPEDQYQVIFEKLRRLTPSYNSKIEGSGIGLYIVDQYVKRMGGTIQVKSKVGEGSTFIVLVPLKRVLVSSHCQHVVVQNSFPVEKRSLLEVARSNPFTANFSEVALPVHAVARVLLVEDTEMLQFVTKALLTDAGFTVDIASSGEEALEKFSPEKYDLIYMDIGLPKMNGYEVARAIRVKEAAGQASQSIPIIALTGHGAIDVQAFCEQAGMQGVLSKPLTRDQAKKIWQRYGQHKTIDVAGLNSTEADISSMAESDILDVAGTIQLIGSQEVAQQVIAQFVQSVEGEVLPTLKTFIEQQAYEPLRLELHKILGSLAYIKASRLQRRLLALQKAAQDAVVLKPEAYSGIEQAVRQLVDFYHTHHKNGE